MMMKAGVLVCFAARPSPFAHVGAKFGINFANARPARCQSSALGAPSHRRPCPTRRSGRCRASPPTSLQQGYPRLTMCSGTSVFPPKTAGRA